MNIDIGSKIKTLRLSKSMTQEQLAKALHVSAQAVSKWENGSSLPDIQLLPALSVALGTSIDSLFSLTDESRFARIDNMLWDKRFLTQQEFDERRSAFCRKSAARAKRARARRCCSHSFTASAHGNINDLASPLARQCARSWIPTARRRTTPSSTPSTARTSTGTRRTTTARSPSIRSFLAAHPDEPQRAPVASGPSHRLTAAARRRARSWTRCTA